MPSKIRVVVADVMKRAEVREIECDLEGLQAALGGYVELFAKMPDGTDWWCNETGRLDGLPLNRIVLDGYDATVPGAFDIHGPILVTNADDDGETVGLTDQQVERALQHLNYGCQIAVHLDRIASPATAAQDS